MHGNITNFAWHNLFLCLHDSPLTVTFEKEYMFCEPSTAIWQYEMHKT
jgi:hypothetical protein